jgi:glycosyltransferase involved in cell wall biosynthesis
MKICLISNLYEPFLLGGAENYVGRVARSLSKEDEVIVITTSPISKNVDIEDGAIKLYRFLPLNLYHTYHAKQLEDYIKPFWHLMDLWNPSSYLIVKKILKKEGPDVVHLNNLGGLSLSVISALRALKLPHVYTLHDFSLLCPRATFLHGDGRLCDYRNHICRSYGYIKRHLAGSPDIVMAPSNFVLDMHIRHGFFQRSQALKIPLGIPLPEDIASHEKKGFVSILFVGQLSLHKGVDVLIDAFKNINSDPIKLDIAGKGQDGEILQRSASDDKRIRFHGFVSPEILAGLYRSADLVIVPSIWYDNSPLVIYEALSYGVPVIASKIGGIPELIVDGYNGALFEAGDRVQLRRIMKELVCDESRLRKMSQNALKSSRMLGMEEHIQRLRSLYMQAANRYER